MARKIKVGDWVINPHFRCFRVLGFSDEDTADPTAYGLFGADEYVANLTILPASPATLAKSHRLMVRYFAACDAEIAEQCAGNYHARKQARDAMESHYRRVIAGKRGKK